MKENVNKNNALGSRTLSRLTLSFLKPGTGCNVQRSSIEFPDVITIFNFSQIIFSIFYSFYTMNIRRGLQESNGQEFVNKKKVNYEERIPVFIWSYDNRSCDPVEYIRTKRRWGRHTLIHHTHSGTHYPHPHPHPK